MNNYVEIECLNCKGADFRFTRKYCTKCYPWILKIEKLETGKDIYNLFCGVTNYSNLEKQSMLKECVRQIKCRLEDVKDSNVLREFVTAHELEFQINKTIKIIGTKSVGKWGLGKINDYLEPDFGEDRRKEFIFQLFAKIKILSKFQIDRWKVYDAIYKK